MKKVYSLLTAVVAFSLMLHPSALGSETVDLAGVWRFAIANETAMLYKEVLSDRVTLPGTTQTNGKGPEFKLSPDQQKIVDEDELPDSRNPLVNVWTPTHPNIPKAWYQRGRSTAPRLRMSGSTIETAERATTL